MFDKGRWLSAPRTDLISTIFTFAKYFRLHFNIQYSIFNIQYQPCRALGCKQTLLPPDANMSEAEFTSIQPVIQYSADIVYLCTPSN
jgi:hypothetical protein